MSPLDRPSARWLAAGGIVGPVAFVAAWVGCGRATTGYSPSRAAISDLAAIGAPTRVAMSIGFVVFGVGVTLYAQALRRWIVGPAWASASVCGLATLGVAAVPLGRSADGLHAVFAVTGYVGLATAPLLASRPLQRAGRAAAARISATVGLACGLALAASLAGTHHGTFQRIGLTIGDAWLVGSAVAILALPGFPASAPAAAPTTAS